MTILAIESSAKTASCALASDGAMLCIYTQNAGLTHSVTLLPMIEAALHNCGAAIADIDAIAVAVGPGSFTGTRIGCATAKGLAFASGKPCRAVSELEAMARFAAWKLAGVPHGELVISAEMDARRGQLYNALFSLDAVGCVTRITPDRAIAALELELPANAIRATENSAWGVALAAMYAPDIPLTAANPTYLRMPQAERERMAKANTHNQSYSEIEHKQSLNR